MPEPTIVTGYDAIDALAYYRLGKDAEVIREHDCGIDIDNAARFYDRERETDIEQVMWQTLLYSDLRKLEGTGYTIEDLFTAKVIQGPQFGNTDSQLVEFSIHEDIFDGESRGTHFEFYYGDNYMGDE
ncbi:hypothetical protein ASE48_08485 [Mycobacterium sp. Root265]|uniref:hypothetical protein n=1 Tax=Mycobacterium sp. Root265 TaxID=1736504 RepID=UPI000708DB77|nr:hypothetical protein [Mycobacterium sp. Root265]KRD08591.1 hypothetical protein ASE48_08485 [Mycobacterium sp. Root265]